MLRLTPVFLCLAALAACSAEIDPGGPSGPGGDDPLKPQPLPEHFQAGALDPTRIHFTRTATGLTVTGDPNAMTGDPSAVATFRLVVAEVRATAHPLEIPVAPDGSFTTELVGTEPTTVQLTPLIGDGVGDGRLFDVDATGRATQPAPSCLLGTRGLWQLGDVAESADRRLQRAFTLTNTCADAVTLQSAALRAGSEFSVLSPTLPSVVPAGGRFDLILQFELGAAEPEVGAPRYDFVEITSSLGRGGFVVRVTRNPP